MTDAEKVIVLKEALMVMKRYLDKYDNQSHAHSIVYTRLIETLDEVNYDNN